MIVAMGASLLLGGGRYLDVKTNPTGRWSGLVQARRDAARSDSAARVDRLSALAAQSGGFERAPTRGRWDLGP